MSADSRLQRLVSNRFLSRRRHRRVSLVASFLPPHRQITICIKCETSDGHSQRSLQQLLVILISLPTPHRAAAVSSHWFWFVIMSLHLHLCCIRRARARTADCFTQASDIVCTHTAAAAAEWDRDDDQVASARCSV